MNASNCPFLNVYLTYFFVKFTVDLTKSTRRALFVRLEQLTSFVLVTSSISVPTHCFAVKNHILHKLCEINAMFNAKICTINAKFNTKLCQIYAKFNAN